MAQIYFIQVGEDGPIKIGFTAGTVEDRLCGIQVASPWKLRILAHRKGGWEDERATHQLFSHLRLNGEWFQSNQTLLSFIKKLSSSDFSWPKYAPTIRTRKIKKVSEAFGYKKTKNNRKFEYYKTEPQVPLERVEPKLRENIALLSSEFLKARKIKSSTLSRLIRGDMHFLDDFLSGKIGVTLRKYDDIVQWFEDHWPEGADMPILWLPNCITK